MLSYFKAIKEIQDMVRTAKRQKVAKLEADLTKFKKKYGV
jgi:hypothetical protein